MKLWKSPNFDARAAKIAVRQLGAQRRQVQPIANVVGFRPILMGEAGQSDSEFSRRVQRVKPYGIDFSAMPPEVVQGARFRTGMKIHDVGVRLPVRDRREAHRKALVEPRSLRAAPEQLRIGLRRLARAGHYQDKEAETRATQISGTYNPGIRSEERRVGKECRSR